MFCRFPEENLYLGQSILNRCRIVGLPISLCAEISDADELTNGIVCILRVCLAHNPPGAVQQAACFSGSCQSTLCELSVGIGSRVDIALDPMLDRRRSAGKDCRSVQDTDGSRDIVQMDVVEDQRSS